MLRRRLMQSGIPDGFVDLGLPSGTLWAKGNIVKNGSTYAIGEETDYGAYFSWGNIDGHNEGEGYNFNSTTYNSTAGASQRTNIASDDAAHDAALACLGSPCHMPTVANYKELYSNTDCQFAVINGISGLKFMKKSDHSVYVFFPRAGYYNGTSSNYREARGSYWLSTVGGQGYTRYISFTTPSDAGGIGNTSARYLGCPVRAVIGPQDWIKDSYEESLSVKFYNSIQDSYYGDSGSTDYYHSDIPCNMEFDALIQRVDKYYSDRKEYTTTGNVFSTATSMDISAGVILEEDYYYVSGYLRLYSNELSDSVDFTITAGQQDRDEGDDTFYFNIKNDNGDVVGSGYCFFLDSGYAGVEITPN